MYYGFRLYTYVVQCGGHIFSGPEPSTDGGHIDFLRTSKAQGTYLLVGLYSDDVSYHTVGTLG